MKFSNNEKQVLKILLDNGRETDREIAAKLDISPQAVGKIRKKLEDNKIISSYTCNLDFEKLGVRSFILIYSDWIHNITAEIRRRISIAIQGFPEVMFHAQLSGDENDFFTILGFRSQEEMEHYLIQVKEVFSEAVKIRRVSPFTVNNLLKFDVKSLMKHVVEDAPLKWNVEKDKPEFDKFLREANYGYTSKAPYKRTFSQEGAAPTGQDSSQKDKEGSEKENSE